jgi:hypothetical protein
MMRRKKGRSQKLLSPARKERERRRRRRGERVNRKPRRHSP